MARFSKLTSKGRGWLLLTLAALFFLASAGAAPASAPRPQRLAATELDALAQAITTGLAAGRVPGGVVLVGTSERTLFRRAFGFRALRPEPIPTTVDTIFDLASLTKVVATTTAIMQLAEEGMIDLEAPVCRYWPEFTSHGKERITVRQLLTHYSGLRPDLDLRKEWHGYQTAMDKILAEKPRCRPDTDFIYSDINFEILGELVHRISGLPLDQYCTSRIFAPLGMTDTGFRPAPERWANMAPTTFARGANIVGQVNDPTAARMEGLAGHAGLFSTADDLARFARMLLHKGEGEGEGTRLLRPETVEAMTAPQSPLEGATLRGFGWALEAPFASNRLGLVPIGAYGHTGYTGTSLWIDPVSDLFVIILTNRVYPDDRGDVRPLRKEVAALVASAMGPMNGDEITAGRPALASAVEKLTANGWLAAEKRVATGTDRLVADDFFALKGLRVGLITNHTGRAATGRPTAELLAKAPGVTLAAIFSPEHGLAGTSETSVASGTDPSLGLPVYSLYGKSKRPSEEMLAGLDALVFDIQDVGARFYTYITTMGYAMEEAAKRGIPFIVLDRPNPINGTMVQGPPLDDDLRSFAGYFPTMPVRHGMTVGEMARMFNAEKGIGANLRVISMQGYRRELWQDQTGLPWLSPSPNLLTIEEAILYPGVAMVEGANISVGRGTETPFELVGAPWVDGPQLAAHLNDRGMAGVRFLPVSFTPAKDRYAGQLCQGVRVVLVDRQRLDAAALGLELASGLYRLHPESFQLAKTTGLIGARWVTQAIREGEEPGAIIARWQEPLDRFRAVRAKYLLY
ncbi:MAG: DUF1343 domain-containing protein [Desulfobulbaceae bacterium]|nr:DUF1343 domain-containing protein [Desulfobulbaceae bacterium]